MVHVDTFGVFTIRCDNAAKPIRLSGEANNLAAYLFAHPGSLFRRERLLDMFWGDLAERRARKAMSNALWQIRSQIELDDMAADGTRLECDTAHIALTLGPKDFVDWQDFSDKINTALESDQEFRALDQLDLALRLYKGDFLEHLNASWAVERRERLQALFVRGMAVKISTLARQRLFEEAIECVRSVLVVDPLRETMQRKLMRLHVLSGNRALAVKQYLSCADWLRREYEIEPMPATRSLFDRIRNGNVFSELEDEHRRLIE
ncbi:BTAD domain-containing putative transcriptional regulator [Sedimentitalea sp.]|uniref:AfsR/SARP family transcriptional regulator n=1 Tax=Sedimentitalea sp. TaxID=2048915 RepID=UPI003299C517